MYLKLFKGEHLSLIFTSRKINEKKLFLVGHYLEKLLK